MSHSTTLSDLMSLAMVTYSNLSNSTIETTTSSSTKLPTGYSTPYVILAVSLVSVVIIAVVLGNLLVVIAIPTDRNLKTTQNSFIASLAVADFLLGLVIMPFSLANEVMGYWIFGSVWCDLWKAIEVLLCTASILSICLISLDRYWSITRAIEYSRQRTPTRAALMIAAVWVLSAIICVPPLFGWKNPLAASDYPLCLLSGDIGYVLYSSMGSFYIPCVIMVFVYFKIYVAARKLARKQVKKRYPKLAGNGQIATVTSTTSSKENTVLCKELTPTSCGPPEPDACSCMSEDESTWPTVNKIGAHKKSPHKLLSGDERAKLLQTDSEDTDFTSKCKIVLSNVSSAHDSTGQSIILITDTESSAEMNREVFEMQTVEETDDEVTDRQHNSNKTDENVDPSNTQQATKSTVSVSCANGNKINEDVSSGKTDKNNQHMQAMKKKPIKKLSNVFARHSPEKSEKHKEEKQSKVTTLREVERHKRKLAKARERRATIVLGLVMAAFIFCWFPFFTLYVISALCNFCIPDKVFAVFFWAGYCNSALNPIIYTIFNREFRQAFHKVICIRLRYCR